MVDIGTPLLPPQPPPAWTASTAYGVGQIVRYNGLIVFATTAHTSTGTFDATKWRRVGDPSGTFHVGVYGAVGDNSTNDAAAIKAAISAACTAGGGIVLFDAKTYLVSGAMDTTQGGNALIPLPQISTSSGTRAYLELRGSGGFGGATVIRTTVTGQTLGTGNAVPCVIGGPSYEVSSSSANFTNIYLRIRDITVSAPANPTVAGIDLAHVLAAELDGVIVTTADVSTTMPTSSWAFGIRMPETSNFAVSDHGVVQVFGYMVGVVAQSEHFNARKLITQYCKSGLALTSNSGWHAATLVNWSCEKTQTCLSGWTVTGGVVSVQASVTVNIGLLDIEDLASGGTFSAGNHILDASNVVHGKINYARAIQPTGRTTGITVSGGTHIVLTDLNAT